MSETGGFFKGGWTAGRVTPPTGVACIAPIGSAAESSGRHATQLYRTDQRKGRPGARRSLNDTNRGGVAVAHPLVGIDAGEDLHGGSVDADAQDQEHAQESAEAAGH